MALRPLSVLNWSLKGSLLVYGAIIPYQHAAMVYRPSGTDVTGRRYWGQYESIEQHSQSWWWREYLTTGAPGPQFRGAMRFHRYQSTAAKVRNRSSLSVERLGRQCHSSGRLVSGTHWQSAGLRSQWSLHRSGRAERLGFKT